MKQRPFNPQPASNSFDAYIDSWHKNLSTSEIIDPRDEESALMSRDYRHQDETPIILGLSHVFPVDALWCHKREIIDITEHLSDPREPELVERGRNTYNKGLRVKFKRCVMRRGDYVASIDGLSEDGTQLLEILPMTGPSKRISDDIINGNFNFAYRMKLEHMLFVSQAKEARIFLYQDECPDEMKVMRMTPHPVNLTWMLTGWEYFQNKVVLGNQPVFDRTGIADWR